MPLENKVALVTGGGQGIGKCTVGRLLQEGMKVVFVEIDPVAGQEALEEFSAIGEIEFVHGDVSREDTAARAIERAVSRFAGIDLLVNNAGIMIRKPFAELTLGEWDRVISVNLTGPFLFSREAAPHLRKSSGTIISIASTRAFMSEPDTEAYSASKGGIAALTHALALSLGPEVRVNCISPGWIEVGEWKKRSERSNPDLSAEDHLQHPAGRVGKPEDIAEIVVFLASPQSSFITAANFIVDGGMTRKMIYI